MARTRVELDDWDDDLNFERKDARRLSSSAPTSKRRRGTRSQEGKPPKKLPRVAQVYGVYRPLRGEDRHVFRQVMQRMVDSPLLNDSISPGVAIQSESRAKRLLRNHFLTPYLNGPQKDAARLGFNQAVADFVKKTNKQRPDVAVRPEGLCLLGHADPKLEGVRFVALTLGGGGLDELHADDEELTAALNASKEVREPVSSRDFNPCISFAKVGSIAAGNALIERLEERGALAQLQESLVEQVGEPLVTLGGIHPKLHEF